MAVALCSLAGVACSFDASEEGAAQEAAHTEGRPTYAQYPWLWADDTEEEFKSVQPRPARGSIEYLPTDHPMAKRLQLWVDRMDAALRQKLPDAMRGTPKPRVILRKSDDTNAWVTRIPVAWNVKARATRPAPADGEAPAASPAPLFLIENNGNISPPGSMGVLWRAHDAEALRQFVKFHNDGFSKCRLSLEEDTVVFGEGCSASGAFESDQAEAVGLYTMSKWVTVTTGFVAQMGSEERVLATIAHELGHYYRAHGAQPVDLLNYFYSIHDADNAGRKPAPDPRYLPQTMAAREKMRFFPVDWSDENRLIVEQRLGFYTDEQEADEIELELLARVGIDPKLGPDAMLNLQRVVESQATHEDGIVDPTAGDTKHAECAALRAKGFKDDSGEWVTVPIGDLSNPHHSFCFRVFNMVHELEAHDYRVAASRPSPSGPSWDELVAALTAAP